MKRGTPRGLMGLTPIGGHSDPINVAGAQAIWPHAQKKLKKKQTSEVINKTTDVVRHAVTSSAWIPHKVSSRVRSRTQNKIARRRTGNALSKNVPLPTHTQVMNPRGSPAKEKPAAIGNGLGSTRAQGLAKIGENIQAKGNEALFPSASWVSTKTA